MTPKVEYYTTHQDGKIQLFSKVKTGFGGFAHNFVAERDTPEEIEALLAHITDLKQHSGKA